MHTLIKTKFSDINVKLDCILALLAYGGCDPDSKTADGKTALHLAVEVCIIILIGLVYVITIALNEIWKGSRDHKETSYLT